MLMILRLGAVNKLKIRKSGFYDDFYELIECRGDEEKFV